VRRLLAGLLARHLLRRVSRSRQAGRRGGRPVQYVSRGRSRGRSRVGFFGPFPYSSTRTRRGGRVAVSGCCLPLALAPVAVPALALGVLGRRRRG
jgi:hypothetical protein